MLYFISLIIGALVSFAIIRYKINQAYFILRRRLYDIAASMHEQDGQISLQSVEQMLFCLYHGEPVTVAQLKSFDRSRDCLKSKR